jgi:hypothetical protein
LQLGKINIHKERFSSIQFEFFLKKRYLRPPTPPPHGDIIIREECSIQEKPLPPLIIRQKPRRPDTPEPIVIREKPPPMPEPLSPKVITISGRHVPPPPRKIIVERLPPVPRKPQSIIIERWLPYKKIKRRVIYVKEKDKNNLVVDQKRKNIIIQWNGPQVDIKKEFKDLGVIRANPTEYLARYGDMLRKTVELPDFVQRINPPGGIQLETDDLSRLNMEYELEGDIYALNLVNLEKEGLKEYEFALKSLK